MRKRTNAILLLGTLLVVLPVSTAAQTAPTFVGIRTFLSAPYQPDLEKLNADFAVLGVPFRGLFLAADLATRSARVGMRGHDASDADVAVARRQESYDLGTLAWRRIDASGTPEQTLQLCQKAIGHPPVFAAKTR